MAPPGICCLIAAWNEAPRIGAVLEAVAGHPLVDEVLVIDDGSTDGTAQVAAGFAGVRVLRLGQNGGKSAAVLAGVQATGHPLLLLLDADLQGLTPEAITALALPVLSGQADVAISLRGNAPRLWRWIGLDYISGERLVPRGVLERIAAHGLPRFGIEVAMNRLWLDHGARIAVVGWPGVASPAKAAKQGLWRGIRADLRMIADLCATLPAHRLAGQIHRMRRQRI